MIVMMLRSFCMVCHELLMFWCGFFQNGAKTIPKQSPIVFLSFMVAMVEMVATVATGVAVATVAPWGATGGG